LHQLELALIEEVLLEFWLLQLLSELDQVLGQLWAGGVLAEFGEVKGGGTDFGAIKMD
jgi:hypothetical protein